MTEPTAGDRVLARQIVAECAYCTPAGYAEAIARGLAEERHRAEQRARVEAERMGERVRELEAVVALAEHDRDAAFERMHSLAEQLERAEEAGRR